MSRVFFASELEGVATFWRIYRRDGVAVGFTSHDRDLYFDGMRHAAAPGMLPSAIILTAGLTGDSAEMQGALSHDSLSAADLAAGRFDHAQVEVGAVDWETLDAAVIFGGTIGSVAEDSTSFSAELLSAKAILDTDPVPRTSPSCRAEFCGVGCNLSRARHRKEARTVGTGTPQAPIDFGLADSQPYLFGQVRWLEGPLAGITSRVLAADGGTVTVDTVPTEPIPAGTRAILHEGCDHLLATCADRFGNAANFRGEPFLPGNDLLAQYPKPK